MPRPRLRRSSLGWALAIASLATASAAAEKSLETVVLVPHCAGPEGRLTSVTLASKTIAWTNDEANLARIKAVLGDRAVAARIVARTKIPYRCIGGLIFTLQRAGISTVNFITDPDQVSSQEGAK